MSKARDILSKLLSKIFLTKSVFFGLDEQKITIFVGPTMKIFGVYATPKKLVSRLPFVNNKFLNTEELKQWANDNGFEITFTASTPKMKKKLLLTFGDVMVENKHHNTEKELSIIIMEELENSELPDSIKNWAKQNPQKFRENLKHVQNLLKK